MPGYEPPGRPEANAAVRTAEAGQVSEWWSYSLSDFLMFSPRTYWRMVESYNRELWPAQLVALAAGLACPWLALRRTASRLLWLVLAAACAVTAWAFHWTRFAQINLAAPYLAAAFAAQALLLVAAATLRPRRQAVSPFGGAVALIAVFGYPLLGFAFDRPLAQAEVFGLMPDPTALATLGLVDRWWLRVIPAAMVVVGALTMWAMA